MLNRQHLNVFSRDEELEEAKKLYSKLVIDRHILNDRPSIECPLRRSNAEVVENFVNQTLRATGRDLIIGKSRASQSALVASTLLGPANSGDRKRLYHLLMTVEMTLQWFLDDLVDSNLVPAPIAEALIEQTTEGFGADAPPSSLRLAQWTHLGVDLWSLQRWRNELLQQLRIPCKEGSVAKALIDAEMATFMVVHDRGADFDAYMRIRANNCGLPIQSFLAAHYLAEASGFPAEMYEAERETWVELIMRHSSLPGLLNDLVDYDRDLVEGVDSAVMIVMKEKGVDLHEAFRLVVERYHALLARLTVEVLAQAPHTVDHCILISLLRAVWAIHVLHMEHADHYLASSFKAFLQPPCASGRDRRTAAIS